MPSLQAPGTMLRYPLPPQSGGLIQEALDVGEEYPTGGQLTSGSGTTHNFPIVLSEPSSRVCGSTNVGSAMDWMEQQIHIPGTSL
jgi:hypothetical protein